MSFVFSALETTADGWRLQVEAVTPNSAEHDDDFPPIEEILSSALQERGFGLVGEHDRTVNAGREEGEVVSKQGDNTICNNTAVLGDSLGNTQGNSIHFLQSRATDSIF